MSGLYDSEAAERWGKEFVRAQEAAAVCQPVTAPAKAAKQAGVDILVGRCPKCRVEMGISGCEGGKGRQICRVCHTWLEFRQEG